MFLSETATIIREGLGLRIHGRGVSLRKYLPTLEFRQNT
jgi:hypothetical protein